MPCEGVQRVGVGFRDHIYGEAGRGWCCRCFHIAAEGKYFGKGKRVITSKVCRGGKAPVVAKIGRKVGWEAVWDVVLSGEVCSIRRVQQIVGALYHRCLGDPSTCPSSKSHLPEETMRQFELSDFQCLVH